QLKDLPAGMTVEQERRPADVAHRRVLMFAGQRAHDAKPAALRDDTGQTVPPAHPRPVEQDHIHAGNPRSDRVRWRRLSYSGGRLAMSNRLAERIFSVGHSHHELASLIGLLRAAGINAVADVRSHPFSQRLPQFNRAPLAAALREQEIDYGFLGDLLG